jgi:23S rRNA G2445 N2-methylase RlmL
VRLRYLLIEAAFIAADMAPALRRERFVSIAGCNTMVNCGRA